MTDFTPMQQEAIDKAIDYVDNFEFKRQEIFRLFGFAGTGKEQPLDCILETPSGPIEMGDISIGDFVFGSNGKPVKVLGVYPQGEKPVFEITFRDGSTTRCGANHLWTVNSSNREYKGLPSVTMTTREILESGITYPSGPYKWKIPLCQPVDYPNRELPLPAYIIGILIGDGSLHDGKPIFSVGSADLDIADLIRDLLPSDAELTRHSDASCPRFYIRSTTGEYRSWISTAIKTLQMNTKARAKFIPIEYLHSSINDRISLLRGLMDSDGSCINNRTSFSTTSHTLLMHVMTLVQSLGGTAIETKTGREDEFHLNVKTFFNPFSCKRKSSKWFPSIKNPPSRYIIDIQEFPSVEQQCIFVDAKDGLYLTDNFIVTHNTTILKEIAARIKRRAQFMAFAGKAAMVLQTKGCLGATTIHKGIYEPRGQAIKHYQDELAMWEAMPDSAEKSELGRRLEDLKQSLNRPTFVLKDIREFPRDTCWVCDEVSQVDKNIGEDMLSFGFPIIACGDPAQLKPVAGEGFFTNAKPDVLLTEIHRQEAGNPVLRLATAVRSGRALTLPYGSLGDSRIVRSLPIADYAGYDQVLCGMNKTRIAVNNAFRKMQKRTKVLEPGEKIICLQNNYEVGLMNGSTWMVLSAEPQTIGKFMYYRCNLQSLDFKNESINVLIHTMPFLEGTSHHQKFWTPMLTGRPDAVVMTYGSAMTVHKAQGSQWDTIAIIDEWSRSDSNYPNWLYTALTRAAKRVTVIRRE